MKILELMQFILKHRLLYLIEKNELKNLSLDFHSYRPVNEDIFIVSCLLYVNDDKMLTVSFSVKGYEIRQNPGRERLVNFFETKLPKNLEQELKKLK